MLSGCDIYNPDSLQILLQKAHAIQTVNYESIMHIESRKGQKVITNHKYFLQNMPPPSKKTKMQNDMDGIDEMFQLVDKTSSKNVDDIIAAWIYRGEPLTKEKIAIDDFINSKLCTFDDLVRLNDEYGALLDRYTELLTDKLESRVAVEGVMRNMEVLQVAIGEIHEQVLDDADPDAISDAMTSLVKDLSKVFDSFHSKVSGVRFKFNLKSNIVEVVTDMEVVSFDDCRALSCKNTLSDGMDRIFALQPYVMNDKQYLASAGTGSTIKMWDLSNNTLAATLKGHSNWIRALSLYFDNGVQMLASASEDDKINLWNLSNNTIVHTLSGNAGGIRALVACEKDDEIILVSGNNDGSVTLWDLDNYSTIKTLQGHRKVVCALSVSKHDSKMYLASGSWDKTIKIWSLEDYSLVRTLNENIGSISSLLGINYDSSHILASGDYDGKIKLWDVESYECIGSIPAHSDGIRSLKVVEYEGRVCLVSGSYDKTIKIWDLESKSVIATLDNNSDINTVVVFMNGDRACLVSGDDKKNIKLWME